MPGETVVHRWATGGFQAMQMSQRALDLGWRVLAVFVDLELPNRLSVLTVAPAGADIDAIDTEPAPTTGAKEEESDG